MASERRRYFRIDDTVQLHYQITRNASPTSTDDGHSFDFIIEQDRRMEVLIAELKHNHPELIELISLLNQKIERLTHADRSQDNTLAFHAREVNISACGLAFTENTEIAISSRLHLFLMLEGKQFELDGLVIDCHETDNGCYVWRVDFLSLNEQTQERLIQYIVKRQNTLLAKQND